MKPIEHLEVGGVKYSFCEATTASGHGRWHIRPLDADGPKYGGGVTTKSLCEHVKPFPGVGGWDVEVAIAEHHLTHACTPCVAVLRQKQRGAR